MATEAAALSPAEASARVLAAVAPLPAERVALVEALGRVLSDPLVSPVTLPAWRNAAMDGYAVRAADVATATPTAPVRLPVAETIAAGAFPSRALEPGEAMRIMTGAAVPEGADSVVRVEDSDGGAERVEIRDARDAGRNVRPLGEDMRAGDVVLAAGTLVTPGVVGVLAACGAAVVSVVRRPRVAIVGSGDELVELDRFHEAMAGRRIVSSNGYALHAAVRAAGGIPVDLGIAADSPGSLGDRLARAHGCDLLISTAGNSAGTFDYTQEAVVALDGAVHFRRVRMRPGAPMAFGSVGATPWLGLPGNPVSALVTFELFARPAIRRLGGIARPFRTPVTVTLEHEVRTGAPALTHFLRAVVSEGAHGARSARLTGPQGSGLLSSMAHANALVVIPEGAGGAAAGATVNALLLDDAAGATELTL